MKLLLKKAKLISIFILAISFLGCDDEESQLPAVSSAFTYTINENTGTVTFINISEDARTYLWTFGDGRTSTEINPIKTFANGTFTITLKAMGISGASNTSEDAITINIPDKISLPVTFDAPNVAYTIATFNGTSFEILDNPDASGTNDKASKVGAITNSGAAFEGINFDVGTQIDLATEKTITMNFWSDVPVAVLMKLEEGTAADIEVTANHGGTGWETINFNFSSSAKYIRLTLFVDGPGTSVGTFYIDDIAQIETPIAENGCAATLIAATSLPLNFEACETFLSSENFGDGISSKLAPNPSKSGINNSDFVLQVDKPSGSSFFAGVQNTFENNFDLTTTNTFKLKVYSTKANVVLRFELAVNPQTVPVTGNPAPVFRTVANANVWTEVEFTFTNLPGAPTAYNQLVIKPDNNETDSAITADGTYYFDDLTLSAPATGGGGSTFDSGLLTNGDFQNGSAPWTIGVGTDPAPVATEGDNTFYSVNVATAGNAFDVNLSQKLEILDGSTYTLTFDAWSDRARTLVGGIGLSGGSFANTVETVNLTTTRQTFTLTLTAAGFGAADARVLFDSGAAVGVVNIDNVSLTLNSTGATFDSGLLTNGDFENGSTPWIIGVGTDPAPVVTEGDNTFYSVNVATAGNSFDVNLSQKLEILDGSTYTLTFDAWSDRARAIVAGIGLSGGSFANTVETVNLTTTRQTFTLTLTAAGFGAADARVLFDSGAAVGLVNIDNVSLTLNSPGGGGTGGAIVSNGDFETGNGDGTGWLLFQNGGTSAFDNTVNNGGAWSGRLATNGPSNPALKQERKGAGDVNPGDVVRITFDHIGSVTQPGAVFNVLLFGEGAAGASFTHVFNPAPALSGTWNTFTGTFTIPNGADVSEGISFLIEAVCGGDAGCNVVANIDNVAIVLNP